MRKINKVSESYADSVKRSQLLNRLWTQIMRETKNEELVQQRQREVRTQNIVIHGFPKETDIQEGNIEADNNSIEELLRGWGNSCTYSTAWETHRIEEKAD